MKKGANFAGVNKTLHDAGYTTVRRGVEPFEPFPLIGHLNCVGGGCISSDVRWLSFWCFCIWTIGAAGPDGYISGA